MPPVNYLHLHGLVHDYITADRRHDAAARQRAKFVAVTKYAYVSSKKFDQMVDEAKNPVPAIEITARARAFSRDKVRQHRFQVDGDVVRVFDPVAGHFSTCHDMSKRTVRRIRKLANA